MGSGSKLLVFGLPTDWCRRSRPPSWPPGAIGHNNPGGSQNQLPVLRSQFNVRVSRIADAGLSAEINLWITNRLHRQSRETNRQLFGLWQDRLRSLQALLDRPPIYLPPSEPALGGPSAGLLLRGSCRQLKRQKRSPPKLPLTRRKMRSFCSTDTQRSVDSQLR